MGTGWRRALGTKTPPTDRDSDSTSCCDSGGNKTSSSKKSPFFSYSPSFPSTPRLRCRTSSSTSSSSSRSSPSSPTTRSTSPLNLSLFRNTFRLRNTCGVCRQSVKPCQGTAIYTAECAHSFHFPCIASHVRQLSLLVCPVCHLTWKHVPSFLANAYYTHNNPPPHTTTTTLHSHSSSPSPSPMTRQYYHHHIHHLQSYYDDDEPLLSPKAPPAKFLLPILLPPPQAEPLDHEHHDDQDFQGFFTNPLRSCSSSSSPIHHSTNIIELTLMPQAALISSTSTFQTFALLITVKAPPPSLSATASRRAPIDLVTVLDVGITMTGAKLQMLKRAMRLVISSLASSDRLSIISFSASPKRVLPFTRMTPQGQRSARRIIDRLLISRGCNVADALSTATKVLEDRRERNPVASIILLSDGHDQLLQANASSQEQSPVHVPTTTRFAHVEIPVNSFDEGKSGGSYNCEPAEDAFAKCVGEFLSVVAQDVRIQLGVGTGSEITAVYCCNGRPTVLSSGVIRLGDLYADEEIELLVELKIPTPTIAVGAHHVMTVRCSYNDPATQEVFFDREQTLMLPVPQGQQSPKMERLRNVFITTRAIAECRNLAERSNGFASAHHLLSSARALLMQSSSKSAADEYIKALEAEIVELAGRRQQEEQRMVQRSTKETESVDENGEPLTPTSAWRAAEQLAKVASMKKSLNRVSSDLHGFENARF